jgi:hypothetical protein
MPYIDDRTPEELAHVPTTSVGGTGYPKPEPSPTSEQVWTAAFQQSSMVVNLAEKMWRTQYAPIDGYSAAEDPQINEGENARYFNTWGERFIHSRSPQETAQIKSLIDRSEKNEQIMAAGGAGGVVANMVAGNLDPTLFLPGSVAVKAGRTGMSIGRAALSIAPAAAMQTGIQETALQLNQPTRSISESAINVATSTIVASVLGAGLSRLISGPERAYIEKQAGLLRRDLDIMSGGGVPTPKLNTVEPTPTGALHQAQAAGKFETLGPSPALSGASAAGAAATDERTLTMVSTPGLTWTKFASPTRNVLHAASLAGRRFLVDLAEVPYRFVENAPVKEAYVLPEDVIKDGVVVAKKGETIMRERDAMATGQGPAVDRMVRMQLEGAKYEMSEELTRLFGEMRFGKATTAPRARAAWQDMTGTRGISYTQFKTQAKEAAMYGDKSDIPQVAAAAAWIRANVFDPVADAAEKTIPGFKRIQPNEGESYFPHMWDRNKIKNAPQQFIDELTTHYEQDQAVKAQLQQSLRFKNAQLNTVLKSKERLEAMAGRVEAGARDLNVRAAERSRDDMGKIVGLNEPEVPAGRAAELQAREVTKKEEAQLFSDLLDALENSTMPLPKVQRRVMGQFETREKEVVQVGAQRKEAGIAAGRSERRLAFLEEKLSSKEERLQLIEDQLVVTRHLEDELRKTIEEDIAKWQGGTVRDAKAAIKAREKSASQKAAEQAFKSDRGEGPQLPSAREGDRLKTADNEVDKAVQNILDSNRDLSRQELMEIAGQTKDRILGSPDGRLAYDGDGSPHTKIGQFSGPDEATRRGSEAARQLNVPNKFAGKWTVDDIEQVATTYLRTFLPDIHLTARFGDAELNGVKRIIEEEYRGLEATAAPGKESKKLSDEKDMVIENIAAIRDRIRGVYGWSANGENMARVAKGVKTMNNMLLMGSSAVASITDATGTIWRYGLTSTFRDGWNPYVKALADPEFAALWKQHKSEMRAMGIGLETALGLRQHSIDDWADSIHPHSKFERALNWAGDKFFVANLLNPLTDLEKIAAGHVAMSNIIRAVKDVVDNKATVKQITDLADNNIDRHMAQKIWQEFSSKKHRLDAIEEHGVYIANPQDWEDRLAAVTLQGAVARDVEIGVVTPGQEKPKWMSRPTVGLLGQFKSFTAASFERTLIANVQRRDAASLQGLIWSTGAGGAIYALQQVLANKPITSDPGEFAREAMARAGWPGWGEEINSFTRKATGFDIYSPITNKESTKYQSRKAADTFLGPTWSSISNTMSVIKGLSGAASGKAPGEGGGWTASNTSASRRLLPLQNAIGIRLLMDEVESKFNGAFGIPKARNAKPGLFY